MDATEDDQVGERTQISDRWKVVKSYFRLRTTCVSPVEPFPSPNGKVLLNEVGPT